MRTRYVFLKSIGYHLVNAYKIAHTSSERMRRDVSKQERGICRVAAWKQRATLRSAAAGNGLSALFGLMGAAALLKNA